MTNMEHAMKQAGVTLPLIHRVWLAVKDHPGADCGKISAVLGVVRSHVSSSLANLAHRKMIVVTHVKKKVNSGRGFSMREIQTYTVHPRMREYELWPREHKPRNKAKAAPAPSPAPDAPDVARPDPFLQALREGPSPNALPVQMLDKPPLTFAPPGQPVAREVPQGVTITLPLRVPTRTEIDRWPLVDARQVYDYLRDYFS